MVLAIGISILSGCGGGGSGSDSTGDGGIIGTAKIPKITVLSPVEAKSKSGGTQTSTINSNGKFNLENTLNEAYLIRTRPIQAGRSPQFSGREISDFLYSIGHSDGNNIITRNIHPYSDFIIRNWFATQSLDIDNEFEKAGPIADLPSLAEINAIETEVEGIISNLLLDFEITGGIDLLATPFDINGAGFDNFLNKNDVTIENDLVTIVFNQNNGDSLGLGVNQLPLATDLTSDNDTPPSTPAGLTTQVISDSEILIQWSASTDDKGVSGYNVFRNGNQIVSTPFTSFLDTGLALNTNFSYRIQAIDSRDQLSELSPATDPILLTLSDSLNGLYNVTVTPTTIADNCVSAAGTFTLNNRTDLTGTVTTQNFTFDLTGSRNPDTGEVTGGLAFVNGQQFATLEGVIDSTVVGGTYQDANGCIGTWEGAK